MEEVVGGGASAEGKGEYEEVEGRDAAECKGEGGGGGEQGGAGGERGGNMRSRVE